MTVKQVYSILDSTVKMMNGTENIAVTNLQGMMSLGDYVLNSSNSASKDDFLGCLVDRIGKTIIGNRTYDAPDKSLIKNSFEFGAVLQKIYVEPAQAVSDAAWGLSAGTSTASFVIAKPTVYQSLFQNRDVWTVQVTIPDIQLRSAFTSAENMSSFIAAIWNSIESAIGQQIEALTNLAYCGLVGEALVYKASNAASPIVVNLLGEYNTSHSGATIASPEAALESADFLKWASYQINLYLNRFTRMNKIFNQSGYSRHTPKEYARVTLLDRFSKACDSYLSADTYHEELVALPNFVEVPYWQGITAAKTTDFYTLEDVSEVNVECPKSLKCVDQKYVIGMITDVETLGIMVDERRTKSQYLPNEECTTFFEKINKGMYIDTSEQHVIFTLAAPVAPTDPASAEAKKK